MELRYQSYDLHYRVERVVCLPVSYDWTSGQRLLLVRGRQYHLGDLYTANNSSAYWYTFGFNWRGFTAWVMALWPVLPGFVRSIRGISSGSGWDHLYDMTYFYGFFVAAFVHWALHTAFSAPRQTGSSPFFLADHVRILEESERGDREGETLEPVDVEATKLEV